MGHLQIKNELDRLWCVKSEMYPRVPSSLDTAEYYCIWVRLHVVVQSGAWEQVGIFALGFWLSLNFPQQIYYPRPNASFVTE